MYTVSSFFDILIVTLLLTKGVGASCTNWTSTRWSFQGPESQSTDNLLPITSLACPSSNKTCYLPNQVYTVTLHRSLNISVDPSELDSIFSLASTGYGPGGNFTPPPFIDRTAEANTAIKPASSFLEVDGGKNKTLYFVPDRVFSYGFLGGCSNETLNGMGLQVIAPAPRNFTVNSTEGTGVLSASTENTNDAGRLGMGNFVGTVLISFIVMAVLL